MAQNETSALLDVSRTSTLSASLSQTIPLAMDVTPTLTDINPDQQPPFTLPPAAPVESDDEVQFIFSAPRRRKKKRRRIDSSHICAEEFRESNGKEENQSIGTPPEPPRRGTTGMVQRLESCHIGEDSLALSTRSGSLPLVSSSINFNHLPRHAAFASSAQSKSSSQFLPIAPFMSMPRSTNPSLQLSALSLPQQEMASTLPENEASNKRKRDMEEAENEVPRRPSSVQRHAEKDSHHSSDNFDLNEMDVEPFNIFGTPSPPSALTSMALSVSMAQDSLWNPCSNVNPMHLQFSAPKVPAPKRNSSEFTSRNFQHPSTQSPHAGRLLPNSAPQKQTVTVPARLIPDQSVSPRTQTVEIPRTSFANQAQARQMMMLERGMMPNGQPCLQLQNPGTMLPRSPNNQYQVPRSVPPKALFAVSSRRPQRPQRLNPSTMQHTYQSDIARRPSLYKIPPWPSPASPTSPTSPSQRLSSAVRNLTSNANSLFSHGTDFGAKNPPNSQHINMIRAQAAVAQNMQNGSAAQSMMRVIPPRTPPLRAQAQSLPAPLPPPIQPQGNSNKRKHSPNLIVDIAETCQSSFPFAAVAERHGTPIQKVFDTFSAIIQLPLLRSATDNRRHGSLGKRRMKEFRDAKKAMEQEMKDNSEARGPTRGRKPKRGPEQPLLRAAIMNNALRGKD